MSHECTETPTTRLLREAAAGSPQAAEDLFPILYDELRRLAVAWMARLPPGQTLQPTALIHEAYLRLVGAGETQWEGRRHFFFAAARAMQHILVEQARKRSAQKRGGGRERLDIDQADMIADTAPEGLLALDEALSKLKETNARWHRVVMLRYFAGLTIEETADVLDVKSRTVDRDWRVARAWLYGQMAEGGKR